MYTLKRILPGSIISPLMLRTALTAGSLSRSLYMHVSIPYIDKLTIDIATCMILLCLAGGIAVPNNSSRFFWINHVATVPILNPITIDPIASYTGLPV